MFIHLKSLFQQIFFFILFSMALVLPLTFQRDIQAQDQHINNSYHSLLGQSSVEGQHTEPKVKPVYNLYQIMHLRRALSPRYIRIINQRKYAKSGKLLQKGILFTYEGKQQRSKSVSLAGDFSNWNKIPMERNRMGIFFYILDQTSKDLEAEMIFRYKFVVNGVWRHDPQNVYKNEDGMGGYYSIFYRDEKERNRQISVSILEKKKAFQNYLVEFAIYLPRVRSLTLVGNFNNWDPEHDPMLPDKNGVFRKTLRLKPGEYLYQYIADGKWIRDKFNHETRLDPQTQELSSYLQLP